MDNPTIVGTYGWIFTIEFFDVVFDAIDQIGLDLTLNQQVIRCNAGLSSIDKLAPGNAFGSPIEVNIAIDDTGTFATQL